MNPARFNALDTLLAHAEADRDEGPGEGRVIPLAMMPAFAAEWEARPGLRTAIRVVRRRPDLQSARKRSRLIAALAEMGESWFMERHPERAAKQSREAQARRREKDPEKHREAYREWRAANVEQAREAVRKSAEKRKARER